MSRNLLAAAATVLAFAGAALAAPATAEVRVFACEPEWAALAEAIGGVDVDVYSATHGRQDAHHIRARPSLIAKVRRADILFCSGAELESGWLPVLMQRGARHVIQPGQPGHIMAADHVAVLDRPDTIDRSLGDIHPTGNPPRPPRSAQCRDPGVRAGRTARANRSGQRARIPVAPGVLSR